VKWKRFTEKEPFKIQRFEQIFIAKVLCTFAEMAYL